MINNHVSVLEIDGHAILYNLNYFQQKIESTTKTMVVVKAFGYGSEAITIAKLITEKIDYFAVAYSHEGVALRKSGIKTPILVLHPQAQNLETIIEHNLEPAIYSFKILEGFLRIADKTSLLKYPIHLKFNTGLNRIGFLPTDVSNILSLVKEKKSIHISSVFSHLAASDDTNEVDFTKNQIKTFSDLLQNIYKNLAYKPMAHLLNTSGIINYPEAQFDMVRLGIGLYGFGNDDLETSQLKNTNTLKSIISQIHTVKPGESVGYNKGFIAKQETKTATIPIGHADGISRKLGNKKGYVLINKQKATIIGNVCMDMIMVDVTKIDCTEGDEVIIFNNQKMIEEIAVICETIPYEILTAISQRVKRLVKF